MKILSYVTHTPHQYDIACALHDSDFYLLNTSWQYKQRKQPANVRFIQPSEVNLKDFDLALLHMGGETAPEFLDLVKGLPTVIICHGGTDPYMFSKEHTQAIVDRVKDYFVVHCNEKEMLQWREYGLKKNKQAYIWHGMKADDFLQCQYKEKKAIIVNSGAWHPLMNNVPLIEELHNRGVSWLQKDFVINSFDDYRNVLANNNVYISPTLYSSFPRSRAEAMHAGLCVLTLNNWDEDKFIKDKVNGFIVDNDASKIMSLYDSLDIETIKKVGKEGQKTARDVFSLKKYREDWLKVIKKII